MGFSLNAFLSSIFVNKATRDIKEIRPIVEQVLRVEPEIKSLSNDALRSKLDEIKVNLQDSVKDWREKVAELNSKIEAIKRAACGYRSKSRYRIAILFHCGKLDLMPKLTP